jgi:uncharacterized ferritin-like protein (DUF455 family)
VSEPIVTITPNGVSGNATPPLSSLPASLPNSLAQAARAIVLAADPAEKVRLAKLTAKAWFGRQLSLGHLSTDAGMPDRPGRPERPELLSPHKMPKRSTGSDKGRFAMMHALAHIELNAVDMTWDLVGRFVHEPMPRDFFDNWVQVGLEEAKHYELLANRLIEMGGRYGDHPAHDGLWQAAAVTGHDLLARIAVVPLVLEARGLDVTPSILASMEAAGDPASAHILGIIYRDEKRHVAFGAKWFRYLCLQQGLAPEPAFHRVVRANFRGPIKPPFNELARTEAGLPPGFYKPLSALGSPK